MIRNPNSKSIIETAKKVTAEKLGLSEEIIENIISFKWKSLHRAMTYYNTVEDSGLGSFKVKINRVKQKIKKLEEIKKAYLAQLENPNPKEKPETTQKKIESCEELIDYLQTKLEKDEDLREIRRNNERLAKPSDAPEGTKEPD